MSLLITTRPKLKPVKFVEVAVIIVPTIRITQSIKSIFFFPNFVDTGLDITNGPNDPIKESIPAIFN